MSGELYIVATPIGNLKDITFRAIETLKECDLIACEDSRKSKILLTAYSIQKPMISIFKGKEKERSHNVFKEIQSGKRVALISDSGTPIIQDPGYDLLALCHEHDIPVTTIPGPNALISALSLSGFPTERFIFEGFLPIKNGKRKKIMESWKGESRTIVFYESPYKIIRNLSEIHSILGNIDLVVARELTKKFEEVLKMNCQEAISHFNSKKPKGEFVILLRGPNG